MGANGKPIAAYGKRTIHLSFGTGTTFSQSFWLADVNQAILGADFFVANHLLIDLQGRRLLSLDDYYQVTAHPVQADKDAKCINRVSNDVFVSIKRIVSILLKFPELLISHYHDTPSRGIEPFITTTGPPVYATILALNLAQYPKLYISQDGIPENDDHGYCPALIISMVLTITHGA